MNEIVGRHASYHIFFNVSFRFCHSIIFSIIFSDFALPSFGGAEQLVQLGGGGPTQWDTPFGGTKYFPSYFLLLPFHHLVEQSSCEGGTLRLVEQKDAKLKNPKLYTKHAAIYGKLYFNVSIWYFPSYFLLLQWDTPFGGTKGCKAEGRQNFIWVASETLS